MINYKKWPKKLGRFEEEEIFLFFYQAKKLNILSFMLKYPKRESFFAMPE